MNFSALLQFILTSCTFIMTYWQVRAHALRVLERVDDEELQCYLLQLVQALRFECSDKSQLSQFLVQRCMCSVLSKIKGILKLLLTWKGNQETFFFKFYNIIHHWVCRLSPLVCFCWTSWSCICKMILSIYCTLFFV